jgi:hypothetical protein
MGWAQAESKKKRSLMLAPNYSLCRCISFELSDDPTLMNT